MQADISKAEGVIDAAQGDELTSGVGGNVHSTNSICVFIKNLSYDLSEENLRQDFGKGGTLADFACAT